MIVILRGPTSLLSNVMKILVEADVQEKSWRVSFKSHPYGLILKICTKSF